MLLPMMLPKLGAWFGSGSKSSERNMAVVGEAIKLAQTTVGAVNANAYSTVAAADAYLAQRPNVSDWQGATADTRAAALIEAQRLITPLAFVGERATGTQALAWPRIDAPMVDYPSAMYASDAIPAPIVAASAELALEIVRAGATDVGASESATANVKREKVDVLETEYVDPALRTTGLAAYPRVMALLRGLLAGASGGLRVVRV
jgi:hypothetical protein